MEIVDFTSTDDWDISPTLVGSRSLGHEGPGSKPKSKLSKSYGGDDGVSSITLQVNLEHIRACYVDRLSLPSPSLADPRAKTAVTQRTETAAIEQANLRNTVPDNVASAALSRIISKADFMHMDVVGQFNLGFIIVRKHVPALRFDDRNTGRQTEDDLFIVDQHAADEKWNFETLQQNTVIESQRLFRPRPLHLTAADELLALENLDVLRQNGFEVSELDGVANGGSIDDDAIAGGGDVPDNEDAEESTLGARLHLVAQPVSKDTVFDMKGITSQDHNLGYAN
ncbi:hypothetical protein ID866_9835 [Astraeus odoratus]|nr:hypothetical protein ID866_9835 [Astraeus odoratus]